MLDHRILQALFSADISEGTVSALDDLQRLAEKLDHPYSYLLKFFTIIHTSNITIDSANKIFKFSNKDKQYLMNIKKIADNGITKIQQNLYECIYEQRGLLDGFLYLFIVSKEVDTEIFNEITHYSAKSLIFPVTGADIMSHFSVKEGKEVGALLNLAKKAWCESKYALSRDKILLSMSKN
jgi:hypothetical protein